MTVLSVFSYGFVAFGPMIVLFCVTVARKPHEVIIMMSAAFFWLLSLLCTSILWKIIPPLQDKPAFHVPFSVILQEVFRLLLFFLLRKADKVLEVLSDDKTSRRRHRIAYVSGLGFGTISAVVQFSNVLRESGGPAIVGVGEVGTQYLVLTSALSSNVLLMLHICWSVLWFSGLYNMCENGLSKPSIILPWVKVLTVFLTHMAVSCLSLLTAGHSPAYFLVAAYVSAVILAEFALVTAGATPSTLLNFFKR